MVRVAPFFLTHGVLYIIQLIKQNWNQFLLVVKATVQYSKYLTRENQSPI